MKAGSKSPSVSPGDLLGTKELLQLVGQKLSSQALLFSLAIVVVVVAAWWLLGPSNRLAVVAILFVFLVGLVGYLFFEEKRKVTSSDPATMSRIATGQLAAISNPARHFSVEVWTTPADQPGAAARDVAVVAAGRSARYRIGGRIVVHFRATQDCYLTLLNIGTSGKLTTLFPNGLARDNRIIANREYHIPGAEYGFEYELKGPPGTEKVKAIATLEPVELLDSHFAADGSLFKSVGPAAAARDVAVVKRTVEALSPKDWAEAMCEFEVKP